MAVSESQFKIQEREREFDWFSLWQLSITFPISYCLWKSHMVQIWLVRLISREDSGLWKLADILNKRKLRHTSEKGLRWLGNRLLKSCGMGVAEKIREDIAALLRSSQPNWEDKLYKEPSTQSWLQRTPPFSKVAIVAAPSRSAAVFP